MSEEKVNSANTTVSEAEPRRAVRPDDLMLRVWQEICRHVEISESTAAIMRLLREVAPLQRAIVRQIDRQRGIVETLADTAAAESGRCGRFAGDADFRPDPAAGGRLAQATLVLSDAGRCPPGRSRLSVACGCKIGVGARRAPDGARWIPGRAHPDRSARRTIFAGTRKPGDSAARTLRRCPGERSATAGNHHVASGGGSRQGIAAASLGPQRSRRVRDRRRCGIARGDGTGGARHAVGCDRAAAGRNGDRQGS